MKSHLAFSEPGDIEIAIGSYVADLIEDGSTIQIGWGGITAAVALALRDKKDLGVHSEMLTDSILDLYEAGAVTNRRKTLWKIEFYHQCGVWYPAAVRFCR